MHRVDDYTLLKNKSLKHFISTNITIFVPLNSHYFLFICVCNYDVSVLYCNRVLKYLL